MNKTLNSLKGLAGMAIILLSLYVGVFVLEGMPAIGFVLHLPSFIIVIGCLLGCTLFLLPLEEIREVLRISTREAVGTWRSRRLKVGDQLEEMTSLYYRGGAGAVVEFVKGKGEFSPAWCKVIEQLDANIPPEDISHFVFNSSKRQAEAYGHYVAFFNKLTAMGPSFGMFGTLLGLTRLLANLEDSSVLGPSMSLALVATMYGVFFSNVMVNPIKAKFESLRGEVQGESKQIIHWLDIIKRRKPSYYLSV